MKSGERITIEHLCFYGELTMYLGFEYSWLGDAYVAHGLNPNTGRNALGQIGMGLNVGEFDYDSVML